MIVVMIRVLGILGINQMNGLQAHTCMVAHTYTHLHTHSI